MSSKHPHEYLDATDMTMLEGVLEQAGYRCSGTEMDTSETLEAARFLLRLVRKGIVSEEELGIALIARDRGVAGGEEMFEATADHSLDRWTNEGGSAANRPDAFNARDQT